MSAQGATQPAPHIPRGRRAQLERMQFLQQRLDAILPCDCPEDCLGEDREPPRTTGAEDGNRDTSDTSPSDDSQRNTGGTAGGDAGHTTIGNPRDSGTTSGAPGPDPASATMSADSHRVGGYYLPGQISRRARARARSRVLARARAAKAVTMERTGEKGRLSMSLQVHADPQGHISRLGYYADLFFTLDPAAGTTGPEQERRHIGYVSTWRLSKEPNQFTHDTHRPWVMEWLRGELGGPDDDSRPFKETMRLLYDENGALQALTDGYFQTTLGDTGDELMFIEMMWIKYKDETSGLGYSGQHIAVHALELFYSLINNGTLPAWYNINLPITFILRPGMPSDHGLAEMWFRERQREPDETEPRWHNRIARIVAGAFGIEDRCGYIRIRESPAILALRISYPRTRAGVIESVLEDESDPAAEAGQPQPQSVLSTIRA